MEFGMNKQNLGSFGEDAAAAFLSEKGFKLLQRNFSCRLGEIDIIDGLSPIIRPPPKGACHRGSSPVSRKPENSATSEP